MRLVPLNQSDVAPLSVARPSLGVIDTVGMTSEQVNALQDTFGFRLDPVTNPVAIYDLLCEKLQDEALWVKGSWHEAKDCSVTYGKPCTDRYCYQGHVLAVMWHGTNDEFAPYVYDEAGRKGLNSIYNDLKRLAGEVVKGLTGGRFIEVIPFNDDDETTWHDVNAVARQVARRLGGVEDNDENHPLYGVVRNPDGYGYTNYTRAEMINFRARVAAGVQVTALRNANEEFPVGTKVKVVGTTSDWWHGFAVGVKVTITSEWKGYLRHGESARIIAEVQDNNGMDQNLSITQVEVIPPVSDEEYDDSPAYDEDDEPAF